MAQSPFTLLLPKRLTLSSKTPLKSHNTFPLLIFTFIKPKLFSSVSPRPEGTASHEPLKPTSLSARLNFVFDQIDQIENRQQQQSPENDATLQRIRAWRQSRNESHAIQQQFQPKDPDSGIAENNVNATEFRLPYTPKLTEPQNGDALRRIRGWRESKFGENKECIKGEVAENESNASVFTIDSVTELELGRQKGKDLEVVHPWPEWIELMERLVQQNYFDHKRRDEGKMVEELGFDMSDVVEEVKDDAGIDFKDFKIVQTACLNFGKDRFDILRSLLRQDIQNLVGFGCPSADKKVVFSAKLLRKHVHLDEGDVCSSCSLRNSCEKAYLLTNKEDEARTVDVMRVLLAYAFHYMDGSAVNESVLKQKSGKTVIRKLLYEVVKLSAVPIDPNLPLPVIKKPPPKVKQPPPPPKKRVGRDDVEMKKGDWLCPKCDFMNFAKNTICLQCDAKRPKRELLPGEWECPECNFLNYRRNMACFHCDCKRPPDAYMESKLQEIQPGPRTRLEKVARQLEVSNGWNFDFDDDESDGADVAVFEFADSSVKGEASPLGTQTRRGKFRGPEDDFNTADRASSVHKRMYSDIDSSKPGIGFDDFDDEDDIDSYEIDTPRNNPRQKASSSVYSDSEVFSELKGSDGSDDSSAAGRRTRFPSYDKPSKHAHKKVALFDSEDELDFDSDEDLLNWKPRHVTDAMLRGRGVSKDLSFDSEDLDLDSNDDDDFDSSGSKRRKENKGSYGRGNFRNRSSGFQGGSFSGSDHEKDAPHSRKNELRQSKVGSSRRGNNIGGYGDYNFRNNSRARLNTKMDGERNNSDNFNRSYRGSRGDKRFGGKSKAGKGEKPVMEYEYVNGGDDLDGSCQPAGVKKRRLTATQVEFLERSFEVENKLESDRKLRLAKELGLQPRQVAIWFQNRRARSKNKQLEKDYDSLRATFDKLKADFDNLLKEKDDLKNQVLALKEKLLIKEKGMENLGSVEAIHSSNDEPQKPNPDASHVPLLACKQEEACSAKSDVFDSDSPHYTDGHGYHSSFIEPTDSSNVFEPDQSDEEDDLSKSLLHPPLFFPKFDCYYDAPATSCNFSLPVEDQSFWSSLY